MTGTSNALQYKNENDKQVNIHAKVHRKSSSYIVYDKQEDTVLE